MNKICATCGKTFYRPKGWSLKYWLSRKYCSSACLWKNSERKKLLAEMNTGERNHSWKGGSETSKTRHNLATSAYRDRYKKLGLCLSCSRRATSGTMCAVHLAQKRAIKVSKDKALSRIPTEKHRNSFYSRCVRRANGCLEWTGYLRRQGYGSFSFMGRTISAHVFADFLEKGKPPEGTWVLHHCDNRKCVEITHLYRGSVQDNMDDMKRRGRARNQWTGKLQGVDV